MTKLTRENVKSPEQQLFDGMFVKSQKLGYKTYQDKPGTDTEYPFVELGYTQLLPRATKTHILGTVFMQINIWTLRNDRRSASDMTFKIFEAARFLGFTDSLKWEMDKQRSDYQLLKVTTETNEKLYRGQIQLTMNFY